MRYEITRFVDRFCPGDVVEAGQLPDEVLRTYVKNKQVKPLEEPIPKPEPEPAVKPKPKRRTRKTTK